MKFKEYITESASKPDIHSLRKQLGLSLSMTKCKNPTFRIFNKGWNTFDDALFTGKYEETLEFLINYKKEL